MKLLRFFSKQFRQRWLPLAALATVMFLVLYATAQQTNRSTADEPLIQAAEDTSRALSEGRPVADFAPGEVVDISKSLAPYLIIYDENHKVLTSTARLDNQSPSPPKGVFEHASKNGENRLTWEPKDGIRQAIVVRPFSGSIKGFVLAGRSLREVEAREAMLMAGLFMGWLAALVATAIAVNITDPR